MITIEVENPVTIREDFTQQFQMIGEYMLDSVRQNFVRGGRPDTWAPLKVPIRKGKGGYLGLTVGGSHGGPSFLFKSGALLNSVDYAFDSESATVGAGAGLPYARAHQFGVPSRNLPARPYMLFQEEDIDWIKNLMQGSLLIFEGADGSQI